MGTIRRLSVSGSPSWSPGGCARSTDSAGRWSFLLKIVTALRSLPAMLSAEDMTGQGGSECHEHEFQEDQRNKPEST
jgi:hypothetical protein